MDEYVDRKAFENVLKIADAIAAANGKDKDRRIWARAICLLHDMPTADVAPVVHGRWGTGRFNLETGNYEEQCTHCRNFSKEYGKPYCPNCGAKMNIKDGGDNDG